MNDTMICCDKSIAILDNYDKMVNDYKQKGITKDPNEIYFDVVGGRKKGLVPGLGSASNLYCKKSSNCGHKSSSNFTPSLVSQLSSQIQQSQDKMCERIAELENRHEKQQADLKVDMRSNKLYWKNNVVNLKRNVLRCRRRETVNERCSGMLLIL